MLKYLPKNIVREMKEKGYSKFSIHHHTQFWKEVDAKQSKNNFGVEVQGVWYWYENWIKEVEKHCEENFSTE